MIGVAAVLGLLAGIPFASVRPPLQAANANVRLAAPVSPAAAHARQAIASCYPVLARAAPTIRPVISVQAQRSQIHISLLPDREVVSSALASTALQATRAASAVADSYVAYLSGKNAHHVTVTIRPPAIMYVSWGVPRSRSTDVLETCGLGALCGALIGAAAGPIVLIPRNRCLRIT